MHTASRPSSKGRRVGAGETTSIVDVRAERGAKEQARTQPVPRRGDDDDLVCAELPRRRGDRTRIPDGGAGATSASSGTPGPRQAASISAASVSRPGRRAQPLSRTASAPSAARSPASSRAAQTGMEAPVPPVGVAEHRDEPRHGVGPRGAWLPGASRSP